MKVIFYYELEHHSHICLRIAVKEKDSLTIDHSDCSGCSHIFDGSGCEHKKNRKLIQLHNNAPSRIVLSTINAIMKLEWECGILTWCHWINICFDQYNIRYLVKKMASSIFKMALATSIRIILSKDGIEKFTKCWRMIIERHKMIFWWLIIKRTSYYKLILIKIKLKVLTQI